MKQFEFVVGIMNQLTKEYREEKIYVIGKHLDCAKNEAFEIVHNKINYCDLILYIDIKKERENIWN